MDIKKLYHIVNRFGKKFKSNVEYSIRDKYTSYRGIVKAVIEEDGREWVAHYKENLIVSLARPAMAGLLAEADTDYVVDTFQIGTQGHVLGPPEDITTPLSPSLPDTSLIDSSPFSKSIGSFAYLPVLSPTSVQFTTIIEKAEANGSGSVTYTEAGLFMTGGNMFARETFAAIIKNVNRRVTFYWCILF